KAEAFEIGRRSAELRQTGQGEACGQGAGEGGGRRVSRVDRCVDRFFDLFGEGFGSKRKLGCGDGQGNDKARAVNRRRNAVVTAASAEGDVRARLFKVGQSRKQVQQTAPE